MYGFCIRALYCDDGISSGNEQTHQEFRRDTSFAVLLKECSGIFRNPIKLSRLCCYPVRQQVKERRLIMFFMRPKCYFCSCSH